MIFICNKKKVPYNRLMNSLLVIFGRVLACAFLLSAVSLAANLPSPAHAEQDEAPLLVVASTAMIGGPAQRIFGDSARVITLMKEGTDPHLYRPTREDMLVLTRADVVLWTGADLEANLRRPINALESLAHKRQLVLTLMDFVPSSQRLSVRGSSADPHIWMDPLLWRDVFSQVVARLATRFASHASAYRQRWRALADDWQDMHESIAGMMGTLPVTRRVLITAHDAFAYFGRRYDISVQGIQGISTESEAGLQRIRTLIDTIIDMRIPAIFSEASVSPRHVMALLEGVRVRGVDLQLGGVLYGDSMGHPQSVQGTYEGMMRHNAETIVQALSAPVQAVDSRVFYQPHPRP